MVHMGMNAGRANSSQARLPLAAALPPATPARMARGRIEDDTPKGRIGNLVMIWRYALRYKWTIAGAAVALFIAAAATLAIPDGFRRVIDQGMGQAEGGLAARRRGMGEDVERRGHDRPHLRMAERIGRVVQPVCTEICES